MCSCCGLELKIKKNINIFRREGAKCFQNAWKQSLLWIVSTFLYLIVHPRKYCITFYWRKTRTICRVFPPGDTFNERNRIYDYFNTYFHASTRHLYVAGTARKGSDVIILDNSFYLALSSRMLEILNYVYSAMVAVSKRGYSIFFSRKRPSNTAFDSLTDSHWYHHFKNKLNFQWLKENYLNRFTYNDLCQFKLQNKKFPIFLVEPLAVLGGCVKSKALAKRGLPYTIIIISTEAKSWQPVFFACMLTLWKHECVCLMWYSFSRTILCGYGVFHRTI